jgi:Prealbumin-like fold domain
MMWAALAPIVVGLVVALPALASHSEASLAGSNFEIDVDANLKVEDPSPSIDWAAVSEVRKNDAPTGQNDDSYDGGSKEDDTCPGTGTGSIPNNKSDLLTFGTYVEPEAGGAGFLHLFWTRVQEPSGTTLMDFELNQSSTDCDGTGEGVNPVRTAGDLLIEYRIEQGGSTATLKVREWTGTAWGPAQDLTAIGAATGTINSSAIPASESDGLIGSGEVSRRTFGEASLDLDFIFDEDTCESFGSAFLKSRASDAFTSQLKDFIAPVPVSITNCGQVIIRKETDPDEDPNATEFGFTKSFSTDPTGADTFTLMDDGAMTFDNVVFGTGYTVTEDVIPAGWELKDIDCSASTGVTPSIGTDTVTFDIDGAADVLDCTFTNGAGATIVVEKVTNNAADSFDFTSDTLPSTSFTLTTTAPGDAGKDSETFSDLAPGTYDVAETVPAGWNLASATCDDGSDPASIALGAGETVTCTFVDEPETGAILVSKTRKHAESGQGDHPHPGVEFTVTGGSLPEGGTTITTDENGEACLDGLVLSSFDGDYDVTETVPAGYASAKTADTVTVSVEATCGDGNEAEVDFHNTPLTNVTVSVDSQVDGGTSSTIDCVLDAAQADDDPSLTLSDLEPQTIVCTIVVDP